jgi:hypothetical protein
MNSEDIDKFFNMLAKLYSIQEGVIIEQVIIEHPRSSEA